MPPKVPFLKRVIKNYLIQRKVFNINDKDKKNLNSEGKIVTQIEKNSKLSIVLDLHIYEKMLYPKNKTRILFKKE